jgi:hypothetical protein
MTEKEIRDIIDLIEKFNSLYEKELSKAPYNLCLLDLCGANENAHTKILVQLLKYKANENHPFLESLLERWFRNKNLKFNYKELEISFNKDFIDGLIKDDQKAVIIENKIHYAPDQNQQIKEYVEKVEGKFRIDRNNIYVVYLTRYGDKKVTDNSCPKDLKEKLGGFVESNYCYDILPWLKEDVLPNCKLKDDNLVSALKQYIDHLDGMFGQRNSNGMDEELKEWLKQKLQFAQTPEKYRELDARIDAIDKLRASLDSIRQVPHEFFVKITRDFWEKYYGRGIAHVRDGISGQSNFILFGKEKWNIDKRNRLVHLEWNVRDVDLIISHKFKFCLHFEGTGSEKIQSFLETDNTFKEMIRLKEMNFEGRLNAFVDISVPMNKTFASLDDAEKESFLNGVYEKYAPLLDYVYEKCEEVYKNE